MITYNFMRMLCLIFGFTPTLSGKETDGTVWSDMIIPPYDSDRAGTMEIYVSNPASGTDATVESCSTYPLGDHISNSTKALTNNHIDTPSLGSTSASMQFNSTWTMNGATLQVTEYALYFFHNASAYSYMLAKGVYKDAVEITNTYSMDFTYILTISKGLTANFLRMLRSIFEGVSEDFISITGGTRAFNFVTPVTTIDDHRKGGYVNAIAGDTTYGLLVGTSSKAYDANNENVVAQNTTLTHGAMTFVSCGFETGGDRCYLVFKRTFTNATSSPVVLTECCLRIRGDRYDGGVAVVVPFTIFYRAFDPITVNPNDEVTFVFKLLTVDDSINVELYATNSMYQYSLANDYLLKDVNADTYSLCDRVESGIDGKRLFLVGGTCYEESTGKEAGKILTGWLNGTERMNRLNAINDMDVTPILIGDRISTGQVRATKIDVAKFVKNSVPSLKADFIQLEVKPDNDFNFLTAEIQDGRK